MLSLSITLYANAMRSGRLPCRPLPGYQARSRAGALAAISLPLASVPARPLIPSRSVTSTLDHRVLRMCEGVNNDPRESWKLNNTPYSSYPELVRRIFSVQAVMNRVGLVPFVHSYPAHLDPVYQLMSQLRLGASPSEAHRRVMRDHATDDRQVRKEMRMVLSLLSSREMNDHEPLVRQHLISANPHFVGTQKGENAMYYGLKNWTASKDQRASIDVGQLVMKLFLQNLGLSESEIQKLGVLESIGAIQEDALKERNSVITVIGVEPENLDAVAFDSHAYGHPTQRSLRDAISTQSLQEALTLQARIWTWHVPNMLCVDASNPKEFDAFLKKYNISFVDPADDPLCGKYFGIGKQRSAAEAENDARREARLQRTAEVIPVVAQKIREALQGQ